MMTDYKVVYSDRKTIRITVEQDRKVVVRAPKQASDKAVSAAIESKRFWIWQKTRDPHKYPGMAPRKEYVAGETFLFLGQHYSLALTSGQAGAVRLVGRQFEMARADRQVGDRLFRAWYMLQAKLILPPRVAAFAAAMGVTYKRIWVRDLKYQWGSCTPGGTLTFNWRILQAPMIVVNYLIVHELAHVLEPNHSHDFRNFVAVHVPSWAKAQSWLKQNGSWLEW
jgi:predicted metal-dependent hydrolase